MPHATATVVPEPPARRPPASTTTRPRTAWRPPIRFLAVALTLIGLLHAYVGWRLLPALDLSAAATAAVIAGLACSTLLIPMGLLARLFLAGWSERAANALAWTGGLVSGLASSLLVLTALRDVVLIGGMASLTDPAFAALDKTSAWVVVASALAFSLVGLWNARRTPAVVRVDIPISDLPAGLDGLTITQISDIHVGPTIRRGYLERIVDRVNALESDLIAITGDLVDGSVEALSHHTRPIERLRARYGTFFVTGNHEYYSGAAAWVVELRGLGVSVLENEHVVLEHRSQRFVVAGVTDYSAHHFDERLRSDPGAALAGAPDDVGVRILLAHQPRSAAAAQAAGFHLQLSGHTHGGQFFPWNFFVRLQQPFTAGLHRLGSLLIYTSRGTGYWGPPKRLGAPAEITVLRLRTA